LLGSHLGQRPETSLPQVHVELVAGPTETVLRGLQDSDTVVFRPDVIVNRQLDEGINHVLEDVLSRELPVLTHLADDDGDGVGLLAPVSNLGERPLRGLTVGLALSPLPVVDSLQAVNHQDEGLVGVGCPEGFAFLEERRNHVLFTYREAGRQLQPLSHHLDLEEAFLCRVEDHGVSEASQRLAKLEHHGCLTRARTAGEHHCGTGGDTAATEGAINVVQAGLDLDSKSSRDLDVQ